MYNLPQKLVAEFAGAFAWVLFGAGAVCANQFLRSSGQTEIGPLGIALAQGLAVAVMVTAVGHISGGHFNPAVTIGFWATRRLASLDALAYGAVQIAGAVSAAYTLRLLPVDVWSVVRTGTPNLASGITRTQGMLLEALMTFFLVLVVFATVADERGAFDKVAGFGAGLTVTVASLFGGPFTGAALNPARAFGPALSAGDWTNHGVYWIGPLAGGIAAAWLYDVLLLRTGRL